MWLGVMPANTFATAAAAAAWAEAVAETWEAVKDLQGESEAFENSVTECVTVGEVEEAILTHLKRTLGHEYLESEDEEPQNARKRAASEENKGEKEKPKKPMLQFSPFKF